jgi:transcriptional regulator with XRE-family HTH domain
MARSKWVDTRFGQDLKRMRDERRWTQPQMADMLSAKRIAPMHATTLAKIEAGSRSVRINEAVAIADLFEVSLDSLLGREPGPRRDLHYALGALLDAVYTSQTQLHRTAKSLHERLQDIPSGFGGYDSLSRLARDVSGQLDGAQKMLDRLKNKLDDELVAVVEARAAKRLREMSAEELEQIEQRIPRAGKEPSV